MYQILIHYDNGQVNCIEAQSKTEVYLKVADLKVNPDEALWELKWVDNKKEVSEELVKNSMGVKND